jgi:hypothetical protein
MDEVLDEHLIVHDCKVLICSLAFMNFLASWIYSLKFHYYYEPMASKYAADVFFFVFHTGRRTKAAYLLLICKTRSP